MVNGPILRDFSGYAEEFINLLCVLMRMRSSMAFPHEIERCAAFITARLTEWGLPFTRLVSGVTPAILVGGPEWAARVPVLLLSHFDVAEGDDDLFEPRLERGVLHGRGSIDDKYAVVLSLLLFREHWRTGTGRPLPFALLITGDEEAGGQRGACVAAHELKPEFCLALDGGGPKEVVTRQKGVLRLSLTTRGRTMQGARPRQGENAALTLVEDCRAVAVLFKELEQTYAGTRGGHWYPTCELGLLRAGNPAGRVPDSARADFDIRYTELDSPEELIAAVRGVVRGEVTLQADIPPLCHRPSPYLEDLLFSVPGADLVLGYGASDAQFFSQAGIPSVIWGAEGYNSQHSSDERLEVASVFKLWSRLDNFVSGLYAEGRPHV